MDSDNRGHRRLVIVSNRLPFTATAQDGTLAYQPSAGGLVSGLSAYLARRHAATGQEAPSLWIGWPGSTITDPRLQAQLQAHAATQHAYPVFIAAEEMDRFYHGFCNETLWPLFHYFPSYAAFHEPDWETYCAVNRRFAEAVLEQVTPHDLVWIHDYHLMLVPQLLRERAPELSIGFFLHIPFPAYEVFRLVPRAWRTALLHGLLGADLIGFHTYEYGQYFTRAVLRTLGYESHIGCIRMGEHQAQIDTFPMSIDFRLFYDAPRTRAVQGAMAHLRERLSDFKVVLSIDRLDYSKGILNRLEGYQAFLATHPQWHGKVVLALVILPSRVGVNEYQETKMQIEELVGRINGAFGSILWAPILYQFRAVPFPELVALYARSDVALITPLRDGMNLIAKEYVASQADGAGVLILSELAGAATELGEALLIMPTSRQEIADALEAALNMPRAEQRQRIQAMQERLARYDVVTWAEDFVDQLLRVKQTQAASRPRPWDGAAQAALATAYQRATRRMFFLDYDGTLVPFAPRPEQAVPPDEVRRLLGRLAADPHNEVIIVSGRDKDTLDRWFGRAPLTLVAEHGTWVKPQGDTWRLVQAVSDDWKAQIRPVLERYTHRLPGALLEEKTVALAWHYRQADPELGPVRAKELLDHLMAITGNLDLRVLQGHKVLEVRPSSVSKALVAQAWAADDPAAWMLAIGDDWTDEDLFGALPEAAYTIKVGPGATAARFRVDSDQAVLRLLAALARPAPA